MSLEVDLQQEQAGIDREILDALVEATPEAWTSARMDVEFTFGDGTDSTELTISNPEGSRGSVEPTDRLTLAVRRLSLFLKRSEHRPFSARYEIREEVQGRWHLKVQFEYAD